MTADPWDVFARHLPQRRATSRQPTSPYVYGSRAVGSRYALRAALEQEAQRVVDAPAGTRNHALNRAAFSLGQLVAGGALPEDDVVDALAHGARKPDWTRTRSRTNDRGPG